jgi:hypothetical protein
LVKSKIFYTFTKWLYIVLHKGKKKTKEHKKNIALSKLKPIIQMDLNGKEIKKWNSLQEAALSLKTSISNISGCLTKGQKTAAKSTWKYV